MKGQSRVFTAGGEPTAALAAKKQTKSQFAKHKSKFMEPKSALKAKHLCLCYLISFLHLWRILKNSKENFEKTQKRIKKNTMLYI